MDVRRADLKASDSVSNWGRWSDVGERGALNQLTPARVAPSTTEEIGFPMHVLALNAMGSPVNPTAIF